VSKSVDWGIDLGTTNSAIARMTNRGPEIVQVGRQNYVPSAVAVDKRGDIKVGAEAYNVHLEGARWFKRLMGTKASVQLGAAVWTPEELSAEILKTLRASGFRRTNDNIEEVVITVPAMFAQPQCEATNLAAKLAGLEAVALLQEPIAAAASYLSQNPIDGNYLVYDLGGGTFDVSLIRLSRGEMNVIEHGGDNYLGGADFDRAIFEWVLHQVSRKGGDTSMFEGGWQRYQLLMACEEARVNVSDCEKSPIYLDEFDLPIAKIELTKEVTEDLIADMVTRTIELSQDRIRAANGSINAVLLVGGPTQMPYIRRQLKDQLKIPLAFDQDPMTAVTMGAAVHAGMILRGKPSVTKKEIGEVLELELFYDPVTPDEFTTIAGRLVDSEDFQGEVRLKALDESWESGWRKLLKGAFSIEVSLVNQVGSEIGFEIRDRHGRLRPCVPQSISIRAGIRSAQPVTPYNYGVVRQEGKLGVIVKAGEPLPASGTEEFLLAKTVVAGSPDEATICFVEGSSSFAEENVRVGSVVIRGTEIRRTLKDGEKVQIRIRMDESRRLTAKVYVPLIDEEFSVELHSIQDSPDIEDLVTSYKETKEAIGEIESLVDEEEQELIVKVDRRLEQLEASLERVECGEVGEAERLQKQLAEVKSTLRPLRDKYSLQAKHDEIVSLIEEAEGLCERFGDKMGLAKLNDLRGDVAKALRLDQIKGLTMLGERVADVFWDHYGKTRECWEYQVQLIRARAPLATDSLAYLEHLRRAEQALSLDDYEGVRISTGYAWKLLPKSVTGSERFHDSALR